MISFSVVSNDREEDDYRGKRKLLEAVCGKSSFFDTKRVYVRNERVDLLFVGSERNSGNW